MKGMIDMEKIIELTPLAEIGKGSARITDASVEILVSGICGGMKAWLIGGEAESIGNLVDGKLQKSIDTSKHSAILITQTGRQMFIGKYAEDDENTLPSPDKTEEKIQEVAPFQIDGFNWKKITEKSYKNLQEEIRYILSNKSVYDNFKRHGHYYVGESDGSSALGLLVNESEGNPLGFLSGEKLYKNGYVIVCVDKKTKKIHIPEK